MKSKCFFSGIVECRNWHYRNTIKHIQHRAFCTEYIGIKNLTFVDFSAFPIRQFDQSD